MKKKLCIALLWYWNQTTKILENLLHYFSSFRNNSAAATARKRKKTLSITFVFVCLKSKYFVDDDSLAKLERMFFFLLLLWMCKTHCEIYTFEIWTPLRLLNERKENFLILPVFLSRSSRNFQTRHILTSRGSRKNYDG